VSVVPVIKYMNYKVKVISIEYSALESCPTRHNRMSYYLRLLIP
jgi:hypothetical protein